MEITELTFVKDEEVLQQECVPIEEEFTEQECVSITEELPAENNVCTLEENKKLGSNLCADSLSECELGFRGSNIDEGEHDSTPSPQSKNTSSGKPQRKKLRETTPRKEHVKTLGSRSVKIPSLQDSPPLTVESTETPHSACFNSSETQGNLKTLPRSVKGGKSARQLGSNKTRKGNHTGGAPLSCSECGKRFRSLSKLVIHERIHTGGKPYRCSKRGKRFNQLGDLKRHLHVHTGGKPYY
ncbi:zinc finger protein 195-like [Polyodon spathula]|uniref:zinc finger protein 195-like n=1 Tax=Polyodon spathula TaxID=7913 RepID=UPI001B7ED6B7|nr:zinc finger protein 195-like [Polyodon spathula]